MSDLPEGAPARVRERAAIEDQWVDRVMPDDFDWVSVVQEHPMLSLSVAAVGGFLLGRWQGQEIVDALSDLAAAKVSTTVNRVVGT